MIAVSPPRTPKPFVHSSESALRPLGFRTGASSSPVRARVASAAAIELGEQEERSLRSDADLVVAEPGETSAVGGEEFPPLVEDEAPADLLASLSQAQSRDEIAVAVLGDASRLLLRAALFIAQADRVIGWAASPEPPEGLRSFSLAFSEPSLFASLRNTDGFYVGPCPDLPGNRRILEVLGATFPSVVAAVPVTLKGKSVLFLVGQARPGETPPKAMELKRLGALTAIALEILLLKNRLRSL